MAISIGALLVASGAGRALLVASGTGLGPVEVAASEATRGAVAPAPDAFGGPAPAYPEELLFVAEGNRLRRVDPDTIPSPGRPGAPDGLLADVLVEQAAGGGRDVNGMVCPFPDGSGRFVIGEDSSQPHPPPGWGVFDREGNQIGKLAATYLTAGAEPHGCAFGPDGTLFTTEVGTQGFGNPNGQLIMWFPPFDRFPGPPGAYPATDAISTTFCKLAIDIGTATGVTVDAQGRVYVGASSGLSIQRFSPPFPTGTDAAHGCGGTDTTGAPLATSVARETFATPSDGMLTFAGLAWAPNGHLYASSVFTGRIAEYDASGDLVRLLLDPPEAIAPVATGTPQSVTVGADGTVYYADLDLVGTLPNVGPGPNGKVWRIRFDASGDPMDPEVVLDHLAFPDGVTIVPGDLETDEWRTFAGSYERRFFNPQEDYLTRESAGDLHEKWRFHTDAIITSSPAVAAVNLPEEGRTRVVYFTSWDHHVYAVRFDDGSLVWSVPVEEQPGATFPAAASVDVSTIDGRDTVIVGVGEILYALDATTGSEVWRFTAGTGCRDAGGVPPGNCRPGGERNEIESSVAVVGGLVVFGLDVNDLEAGKGGVYALDASDGTMAWFLDLQSGAVCRPAATDEIRRFDGYHTELELGLPAGFLVTRDGCDFPRDRTGCENTWSSPAYDPPRGLLYVSTSNCDTDDDPATTKPPPPMPPYDEALVSFRLDGTVAWKWRPREIDNDDLAFGAAPNLFSIERGGRTIEVVGLGNKDGSYTVLDRDGVNEESGVGWGAADAATELPYWSTKVVPGGDIGGIPQTAAVDEPAGRVYFTTAPGFDPLSPQHPTAHALDLDTGAIVWQNTETALPAGDASFGPTSAVPGLVFAGSVITPTLRVFDATDGTLIKSYNVGDAGGIGVASGAAAVDGTVLVGSGVGARTGDPGDPSEITSRIPSSLVALCAPGAPGCVPADSTAPTTTVVVPSEGAALSGTRILDAVAFDNVRVTRVEFRATGGALANVRIGTATLTYYGWVANWNTKTVANGTYTISSVAFDAAGNSGRSAGISVKVDNTAPTVRILQPSSGAALSGTRVLRAIAFDNVGVTRVEFRATGGALANVRIGTATLTYYGWLLRWNTETVANGTYAIKSVAFDAAGNRGRSAGVSVNVDNRLLRSLD